MTDMPNAARVAAISPFLPDDQRRLIERDNAVAKVRPQIAADLAREKGLKTIDPDCFHPARTALRQLCRAPAELFAPGTGRRWREKLTDALIGILRKRHDVDTRATLLPEAQACSAREGL